MNNAEKGIYHPEDIAKAEGNAYKNAIQGNIKNPIIRIGNIFIGIPLFIGGLMFLYMAFSEKSNFGKISILIAGIF